MALKARAILRKECGLHEHCRESLGARRVRRSWLTSVKLGSRETKRRMSTVASSGNLVPVPMAQRVPHHVQTVRARWGANRWIVSENSRVGDWNGMRTKQQVKWMSASWAPPTLRAYVASRGGMNDLSFERKLQNQRPRSSSPMIGV